MSNQSNLFKETSSKSTGNLKTTFYSVIGNTIFVIRVFILDPDHFLAQVQRKSFILRAWNMKSIKQGDIILQPLNYYKSVVQENINMHVKNSMCQVTLSNKSEWHYKHHRDTSQRKRTVSYNSMINSSAPYFLRNAYAC